jgi:Tfp pilus assembly protein PilX
MPRPVVKTSANMRLMYRNDGSAFIIVVFVVALLAAVVMGMLQINTEEIQIMRNQIYAAEALAIAEAGLNDALAEIRIDSGWVTGFADKAFSDGSYTVTVGGSLPNLTITSTGTSSQGFVGRLDAVVTVGAISPHTIRIDSFRINREE